MLTFQVSHDNGNCFVGMVEGILPSFERCRDKRMTQLRVLAICLFENIDTVFGKIEAVFMEKERGQLVGIETTVQDRVIFVVPHGRRDVDTVTKKEVDGI